MPTSSSAPPPCARGPSVVVGGVGPDRERERRVDVDRCADAASGDVVDRGSPTCVEWRHPRLDEQHPSGVACHRHGNRVSSGGCDRLLTQHVFTACGSPLDPLPMHAVGERDVDSVDIGVFEDVVVGLDRQRVPGFGDGTAER